MKHVTSPLSAALFIYYLGKANLQPQMRAWWRSVVIRRWPQAERRTPAAAQPRTTASSPATASSAASVAQRGQAAHHQPTPTFSQQPHWQPAPAPNSVPVSWSSLPRSPPVNRHNPPARPLAMPPRSAAASGLHRHLPLAVALPVASYTPTLLLPARHLSKTAVSKVAVDASTSTPLPRPNQPLLMPPDFLVECGALPRSSSASDEYEYRADKMPPPGVPHARKSATPHPSTHFKSIQSRPVTRRQPLSSDARQETLNDTPILQPPDFLVERTVVSGSSSVKPRPADDYEALPGRPAIPPATNMSSPSTPSARTSPVSSTAANSRRHMSAHAAAQDKTQPILLPPDFLVERPSEYGLQKPTAACNEFDRPLPSPAQMTTQPLGGAPQSGTLRRPHAPAVGFRRFASTTAATAPPAASAVYHGTAAAGPDAAFSAASEPPAFSLSPLHSLERLQDYYDPYSAQVVLHHLSDLWLPTEFERLILELHQASGMPWWGTILATTLLLRTVALPFNILYLRNHLRVKKLRDQCAALNDAMDTAPDLYSKQQLAERVKTLFRSQRCHPVFSSDLVVPFAFPIVFLSYFLAVHNLCIGDATLATGGTLWFPDLMSPDPTNLLPIVSGLTWLNVVEYTSSQFYLSHGRLKMLTRLGCVAIIPLTMNLPAGVFCFWITSNLWEIVRILVMQKDGVRRFFNIPLTSELPAVQPVHW